LISHRLLEAGEGCTQREDCQDSFAHNETTLDFQVTGSFLPLTESHVPRVM
jgi:hypothetical protein